MGSRIRAADEPPELVESANPTPLLRATGAVSFRDVSFEYRKGEPVLHDISFDVAPGTRVGIVGPTGSGKSTLVSLLTRFYDPTAGQVLLDGVDIREFRFSDLRNQFAVVLQQPVLFTTTIAGNIAYGRPDAPRHDIIAAAQAANAHEFIMRLPQGYDTLTGERGVRLSGGEAQRIALARTFLKHAPIIIMDEPTSSVDSGTEAAIIEATESLMRGCTTFIIAPSPEYHRELRFTADPAQWQTGYRCWWDSSRARALAGPRCRGTILGSSSLADLSSSNRNTRGDTRGFTTQGSYFTWLHLAIGPRALIAKSGAGRRGGQFPEQRHRC